MSLLTVVSVIAREFAYSVLILLCCRLIAIKVVLVLLKKSTILLQIQAKFLSKFVMFNAKFAKTKRIIACFVLLELLEVEITPIAYV